MIDAAPCEAIILRYTNYGEADRIVSLLTKEHGVCSAFARNARKSRRRFGGALQPFNRIRVLWQQRRRAGMAQLAEIELLEAATPLVSDLDALSMAAYGCELVSVLLPEEQPVDDVYRVVAAFLSYLPHAECFAVSRLLLELRLLELAGLLPHIGHCACCWQPLRDDWLVFDARRGGTLCPRCAPDGVGVAVALTTLGSLVRLLRVEPTRFSAIRLSDETLQQGGAVMHQVLGLHIGRTLKSEQFLRQIQQAL
ncbi:MAG: DNA repair protein RecO [Desulfuromonadales bacterium C00003068]|nr:MAG: DNA repair protein RecO [Desulfuromonadales bacterium C00003068]